MDTSRWQVHETEHFAIHYPPRSYAADRLASITAPTLVIHGTDDEMLLPGNAELIAKAIPGARLEIFDGVGHLFWWEQPERTAALLRGHAVPTA